MDQLAGILVVAERMDLLLQLVDHSLVIHNLAEQLVKRMDLADHILLEDLVERDIQLVTGHKGYQLYSLKALCESLSPL